MPAGKQILNYIDKYIKKNIRSMLFGIVLGLFIMSNQAFATTCGISEGWGIKNSIKYILQADSILYAQAQVIQSPPDPTGLWTHFSGSQKTKFMGEMVYKGVQEIELLTSFSEYINGGGSGYHLQNGAYYLVFSKKNNIGLYEPLFEREGMCSEIFAVSKTIDMTLQNILYIYMYRFYFLIGTCILVFVIVVYILNRKTRGNKRNETVDIALENQSK